MNTLTGKISSLRNFRSCLTPGAVLSAAIVALGLICPAAFSAEPASSREHISLDAGWRFIPGDPDDTAANSPPMRT